MKEKGVREECPECNNGLDRKGMKTDNSGKRGYVFCSECGHTNYFF
jgi:hypothetical protein